MFAANILIIEILFRGCNLLSSNLIDATIGSLIGSIIGVILGTMVTLHLQTKSDESNRKKIAGILLPNILSMKDRLNRIQEKASISDFNTDSPFSLSTEIFLPLMSLFNSELLVTLDKFNSELKFLEEFRLKVKKDLDSDKPIVHANLSWDLNYKLKNLALAKSYAESLIGELKKELK